MSRRILLLLLTTALALVLGFWSFTPEQAVSLVRHGGYWAVLASTSTFIVLLVRSLRNDVITIKNWRTWGLPVSAAILVACLLHLHERHELKIVADEVVLQLTAKQMHFFREASVVVRGYEYAGNFTPMGEFVDKRPLLFPFLVSTVHGFSGFRPANVYFLNFFLSIVLMLLLLLIGRRFGGWGAGISAVLLIASIPLVAQNATGAGFELLNMVMIVTTIWLGMRAGEQPQSDDRLGAFVLSGVLLAQVRYESVLFIIPVAAGVIYVWWLQKAVRLPWSLLGAPLFLVICPLHYNVFRISQASWQLGDVAGANRPFGFEYFYDNVGHALNFFLSIDGTQGNSLLVGIGGAFGLGLFAMLIFRHYHQIFRGEPGKGVFAIFLLGLVIHTFFMLCYFWGRWDDPIIRRLSLPAHLLLTMALIATWPYLVISKRRWVILGGLICLYIVSFTLPSSAMHRFTQENFAARVTNWLAGHIREMGDRTVLAIDRNAALQWFLYDKSSVNPMAVVHRPDAFLFHFRNRSFAEYLIVQRATPDVKTGARIINEEDNFGGALQLELIEERAFAPLYLVRLSRILSVDEQKLTGWAEERRSKGSSAKLQAPALSTNEHEDVLLWLRQLP